MPIELFREECGDELYERLCYMARYYNANYYACAVVAFVNSFNRQLYDWVAYMGGCPADVSEADAVAHVAENGDKLSREEVSRVFPDLPIERYRG